MIKRSILIAVLYLAMYCPAAVADAPFVLQCKEDAAGEDHFELSLTPNKDETRDDGFFTTTITWRADIIRIDAKSDNYDPFSYWYDSHTSVNRKTGHYWRIVAKSGSPNQESSGNCAKASQTGNRF